MTPRDSACNRNRDLVLKMVDEGYSLAKIGRTVGTNGSRVKQFLLSEGVTKKFSTASRGQHYPGWKPKGKITDQDGYISIYCPNHPFRRKHTPYVLEHRLVMEKMIGRYLRPEEVVHHRDGNKANNSPDNLQLFSENAEHLAHELKGRCPKWTPEGQERIRELIDRNAKKRRGQIRVPLTPDEMQSKRTRFRFVKPRGKAVHTP